MGIREIGKSKTTMKGNAGEYLVCFDLTMQGYPAAMAQPGLSYDVIVDVNGTMEKIQVKSSSRMSMSIGSTWRYSFSLDKSHEDWHGGVIKKRPIGDCDYYAFVALDIRRVAYLPWEQMSKNGIPQSSIRFKSRGREYVGRSYDTGSKRQITWGKFFEDFTDFSKCLNKPNE